MTAMTADQPDFIGCYDVGTERHFYGATGGEIFRSAFPLSRVLRTFAFAPGSNIVTISTIPEVIQYGAFERAVQMLGFYGVNAEDSPYDAGRVESVSRQFGPVAICGVARSTLDGLAMLGHDPAKVFAGRVIWARPEAYEAATAMESCDVRRVASIGPMLALECARGGLHFDNRDWDLETRDGQLFLSSRLDRVEALEGIATGFSGMVSSSPCPCGVRDAVVTLT